MFKRLFISRAYVGALLASVFILLQGHAGICHAQATDKSVQPKTFSGGILNRKAIEKPNPTYPLEARQARVSGVVVVEILVDENGKVEQAKAVSGHPLYDRQLSMQRTKRVSSRQEYRAIQLKYQGSWFIDS